jgi:hypothetical protein
MCIIQRIAFESLDVFSRVLVTFREMITYVKEILSCIRHVARIKYVAYAEVHDFHMKSVKQTHCWDL